MSAATFPAPDPARRRKRHAVTDARPGIGRLTAVELRKMVNTRSGFWVPIAVALVSFAVALISTVNHGGRGATLVHVFHATVQPAGVLLPVLGVLLICGEWHQRTTLTTFTLVPSRRRVIVAKLAACVLTSIAALIATLILALACTTLLGNAPGGAGVLPLAVVAQGCLFICATMVMGLAFGAAILVTAPAVVAYLLLPVVWDAVIGGIHSLATLATWLDSAQTLSLLAADPLSAAEWAHVATTLLLWVGAPLTVGLARIGRGDID